MSPRRTPALLVCAVVLGATPAWAAGSAAPAAMQRDTPAAGRAATAAVEPWIGAAAVGARAILASPDDPRAWAGLAAALHAPGLPGHPAALTAAGELARAVADSIAAAAPALSDIVIASHAAGTRIALHGNIDAASLHVTLDSRDATRLFIDLPGVASALAWDEFAGIGHAGVRRILLLRLPASLRLVVQLDAPYDAARGAGGQASVELTSTPVSAGTWHARDARPAVAAHVAAPAAASPATDRLHATLRAAAATTGAAGARAAGAWHAASRAASRQGKQMSSTATRQGALFRAAAVRHTARLEWAAAHHAPHVAGAAAGFAQDGLTLLRRHVLIPVAAAPERAAIPAAAFVVCLMLGIAVRRRRHRAPAGRAAAGAKAAAASGRLRSASSLIAAGHDPVAVARRTRLSRDAVRLLALRTATAR